MIRYHFDLYPRDDPRDGTRVVRFTKLQSAEYRGEANGTGAGRFSIRADTAEAQNIDPAGLQYVRVVREDTVAETELVVGGFFLDSGDFKALDERGTRLLTFGGAGTLSYLARSVMASHTYISPIFTGQDPFDDTWRLYAQSTFYANGNFLGAMLWRVIYEAQHFTPGSHKHADGVVYTDTHDDDRTESAIPDLTMGFDAFEDSNGNAWTVSSGEFKAQVGENVLGVVKRLMEAGLYVSMDPDTFELNAYPASTHRRDRTGAAWGAAVIRFQAPTDGTTATGNIKSDANRAITAFIRRSWILAGSGDVYGDATGTSDIPWEGFYYSDTQDTDALENIAGVQLGARDDAGDTLRLRGRLGNDPANGFYLPFEHVLLDDLGTIHTGTGQWDYNEQDFPVAAITLQLRPGGDWDVWYDMGSSFSATERRFQVTPVPAHNHGMNPQLCDPFVPGSEATVIDTWTWSEPGPGYPAGFAAYQQTVAAQTINGGAQASFVMSNGLNNTQAWYRSATAGSQIPAEGAIPRYLPCTAGTDLVVSGDVGPRGSSGTRTVNINWHNSSGGFISSTVVHNDSGTGFVPFSATVTPPALATTWQVHLVGTLDNFTATIGTGTDPTNPYAGNSNQAARCDHTHAADEHDHDADYAAALHGHRADEINIDDDGGYFTGTDVEAALQELGAGGGGASALDDLTDVDTTTTPPIATDVLAYDGSLWVPTAAGTPAAHATSHEDGGADEIEIANLPTAESDTALVLHPDGAGGVAWGTDATGGGGGSWAGPDPATATALTVTGTATWTVSGEHLSVAFNSQSAADVACLLIPIGSVTAVSAKIQWIGSGNYTIHGILFTDGTVAASNGIFQQLTAPTTTNNIHFRTGTLTNLAANLGVTTINNLFAPLYMRTTMVAANTWRAEWSPDGVTWTTFNIADQSYSMTPTHIGVAVSAWGGGGVGNRVVTFTDWSAT